MPSRLNTELRSRAAVAQGGGIYRIVPQAVARPTTRAALREVIEAAAVAGLPLTPRAAGSAMGGGNLGAGVVLDLRDFERDQLVVHPAARTAVASPAVTLAALQAAAHPFGMHLPLDPSSARWATLGGLVGTNAAGARTVRDGPMRNWVEALVLETGEGPLSLARGVTPDHAHPVVRRFQQDAAPQLMQYREAILARWPRTRKNTLGYALDAWYRTGDLIELVIGAEGTLGAVSELGLRLAPRASVHATLRISLASRAAMPTIIEVLHEAEAVRIEFLDASFLRFVHGTDAPELAAILLVDLEEDDPAELGFTMGALVEVLEAIGPEVMQVEQAHDPAEAHALWAIRHGASSRLAGLADGRRSLQVIEDGCVPVPRLPDYLHSVEAACARQEVDVVLFGHAGDGHVHVNLLPDLTREGWLDRVRTIFAEVNAALLRLGGTPAGEHGTGRLRSGLIEPFLGPEAVAAFRAVKTAFDPEHRWNPGVILPEGDDPFVQLKVGEAATPLPEGMAEAWQRVEAEARWGEGLSP
jgi:FAD/FMN-containing dehydrogenase